MMQNFRHDRLHSCRDYQHSRISLIELLLKCFGTLNEIVLQIKELCNPSTLIKIGGLIRKLWVI